MLLGVVSMQAQEKGSYIYVNGGGGLHSLQHDIVNGSQKGSANYTINLGYDYFFTPNWGLGTGIGFESNRSESTLNYLTENPSVDTDGDTFLFRTYYNDWKEKQKALLIEIPISVSYKSKLKQNWKMQFTVGAKMELPVQSSYEIVGGDIETTGYYPQYDVELYGLPQHNFNTLTSFPEKDIALKSIYSAFADAGVLCPLNSKLDLYLGVYASYGLNNAIDAQDNLLYQEDGVYNGVFASNQTDKVTPLAFGLKVGLTWQVKRAETSVKKVVMKDISPAPPALIVEQPKPLPEPEMIVEKPKPPVVVIETPEQKAFAKAKQIAIDTDVKFVVNSDKVTGDPQEDKLKDLAKTLKSYPNMKIHIVGHTCNLASKKVNIRIGKKRAEVIYKKLIAEGVDAKQMSTESKWFSEPLVPNTSEQNRAQNRRVQLIVD